MAEEKKSMVFNNPTDRPASYGDTSTGGANITRLVEDSDVHKTIRFDEISIENTQDPIDVNGGNKKINQLGIEFPIIRINDVIMSRANITSMNISMSGFMPTISLTLAFSDTFFVNKNMPKDGDIVSVYIRTNNSAVSYLRDDFIITSCSASGTGDNIGYNRVYISGTLFIPGFDAKDICYGYIGTSKSVIKKIAKEFGVGFAYNDFDDTDDFQNWIRCNISMENFINDIVDHAWKNETSFFKAWVDLYYNICYSNVNKFLLSTENEETVDMTLLTNTVNFYNITDTTVNAETSKAMPKILSNSTDLKGTPFYIKKWTPHNNSSSISLSQGYSVKTFAFMHNQNIINKDQEFCFQSLVNVPAYDQNKLDTYMVLRGRSKYDKDLSPDKDMARVNHDFVNTYNKNVWCGVEYVLNDNDSKKSPNDWAGNVHKNFKRAQYHNEININELDKMYLDVELDGLCLQAMKGERIPVMLFLINPFDREINNERSTNDTERSASRLYSGYYIIDSIEYEYRPTLEMSPFTTKMILKRREWPTPEQI